MKRKQNENFDPNGNYTGKYIKEMNYGDAVVLTQPEQDADDL